MALGKPQMYFLSGQVIKALYYTPPPLELSGRLNFYKKKFSLKVTGNLDFYIKIVKERKS